MKFCKILARTRKPFFSSSPSSPNHIFCRFDVFWSKTILPKRSEFQRNRAIFGTRKLSITWRHLAVKGNFSIQTYSMLRQSFFAQLFTMHYSVTLLHYCITDYCIITSLHYYIIALLRFYIITNLFFLLYYKNIISQCLSPASIACGLYRNMLRL